MLGVTLIAHWTHAVPYGGSPTVVSQEVQLRPRAPARGQLLFYIVQLATMLILYTGGNTSFNGFPFLASFVAEDSYLPRQLTRRGHRLAFSNGIIVLTVVALWPCFWPPGPRSPAWSPSTPSACSPASPWPGPGMVKHHLDDREDHWRRAW